ncbi:hypothetical protein LINPERPRIM_LOCUS20168, partial [Linum perenne]
SIRPPPSLVLQSSRRSSSDQVAAVARQPIKPPPSHFLHGPTTLFSSPVDGSQLQIQPPPLIGRWRNPLAA